MQKQTTLYIPKPCHENWDKMTPTQQGKFCSSCNKQVVDFSLMSDNQILNFLSHQSGKLCGRFDTQQLERPLVETKIKKKNWRGERGGEERQVNRKREGRKIRRRDDNKSDNPFQRREWKNYERKEKSLRGRINM